MKHSNFMKRKFIAYEIGIPLDSKFNKFLCKTFVKLMRIYLFLYDFITSFKKTRKQNSKIKHPKKILISNIAHLGDIIVTTSVVPIIKKYYPDAKLYFLANSSNIDTFLKDHNSFNGFFSFDHLRLNKKKISFIKKIFDHYRTKRLAIKAMKKEKIDLAIDFFFNNPNSVKILHKAKIPNILAHTNGGYENLITLKHTRKFNPYWHMTEYHLDLLNVLFDNKEPITPLQPNLPDVKEPKYKELKNYGDKNFVLIHPGAGEKKRFISLNQAEKILDFVSNYELVLLVGSGKDENDHIEKIINGNSKCINLSNKLVVMDLIYLCSKAKLIISTDSSIAHIASNFDNPQIVLYKNVRFDHQNLWSLNKPNIIIGQI